MDSEDFLAFLRNTAFSSRTTTEEKFALYQRIRRETFNSPATGSDVPGDNAGRTQLDAGVRDKNVHEQALQRPTAPLLGPEPKSVAERSREYRARKKASETDAESQRETPLSSIPQPKTVAERSRQYRAKKKTSEKDAGGQCETPVLQLPEQCSPNPQPETTVERSRQYRATKKASEDDALQQPVPCSPKPPPKTAAERMRDSRARKKISEFDAGQQRDMPPPQAMNRRAQKRRAGNDGNLSEEERNQSLSNLTLCALNVQSLRSHSLDISSDFVVPSCSIIACSETWLSDAECDEFELEDYSLITRHKRDSGQQAGGVAIYDKNSDSTVRSSRSQPLIRINEEKTDLEVCNVQSNDIGDICTARTTIGGVHVLLATVYLSYGTTLGSKIKFFERHLAPYSLKLKGMFPFIDQLNLHELPIVVCGDFNVDFRSDDGHKLCEFLTETFGLQLINSVDVSTTRNMTCIDGIFSRNLQNLQTLAYVSYFSHHRPLLAITVSEDNDEHSPTRL